MPKGSGIAALACLAGKVVRPPADLSAEATLHCSEGFCVGRSRPLDMRADATRGSARDGEP